MSAELGARSGELGRSALVALYLGSGTVRRGDFYSRTVTNLGAPVSPVSATRKPAGGVSVRRVLSSAAGGRVADGGLGASSAPSGARNQRRNYGLRARSDSGQSPTVP